MIIPGLGGFVSQYRPAVIDKSTGTFIPPTKEIVFNCDLLQNDGVLVGFIAKEGEITVDLARQQIDLFVEETKTKLENNTPVFIDGIGHFIQDKNRGIRFQADAGTNLFLESFGLASFHLSQVAPESKTELSGKIELHATEILKPYSNRNLRRIAIAVPFLIVFSLLPYHSRVTGTLSSSAASMIPEPSLFRLNYPDVPGRDTVKVIVFPIQEEVTSDRVQTEVVKTVVGKYPVIAGCFKIRGNAEKLQKELAEKGYGALITASKNGFFKVSIDSFATRQEAADGLARLKQAEPGLQLWVAL